MVYGVRTQRELVRTNDVVVDKPNSISSSSRIASCRVAYFLYKTFAPRAFAHFARDKKGVSTRANSTHTIARKHILYIHINKSGNKYCRGWIDIARASVRSFANALPAFFIALKTVRCMCTYFWVWVCVCMCLLSVTHTMCQQTETVRQRDTQQKNAGPFELLLSQAEA